MNRRSLLAALTLVAPAVAVAEVAKLTVVAVSPAAPPYVRRHRVSADQADPSYDPFAAGYVEVYFNGKKLDGCITADEDLGTVLCYRRSFDTFRGYEHYELRGNVRIIYTKGHPLNPHREDD